MSEENMLNPQIVEMQIGIRKLRKINVYPLSLADELKFTKKISDVVNQYINAVDVNNDIEVATLIARLLSDHIGEIITLVTDEDGDALLSEMTNDQALAIADVVYEINFGALTKNLKSLVAKIGLTPTSAPARPLPRSAKNTTTRSKTSTAKASKPAASPEGS